MTRTLTYLACPYAHHDPAVCEDRFLKVNTAAAVLIAQGYLVFSPISHSHPIAACGALPSGWDFWERFDRAYLDVSERVVVLRLGGWRESVGVTAEIAIARAANVPVYFMDEGDDALYPSESES